jgi:hypothetical protein
MMESTKISQTSQRGLQPVSSKLAGQYEQMRSLLRQRLGSDHAFLFAEPVRIGSSHETAWFAESSGSVTQITDLSLERRREVETRVERLASDIRNFAEQIERQGDAGRDLARILQDSLVVPTSDSIWLVDGRPVLTDWGWRAAADQTAPKDILALIAAGARSKPAPARPEQADTLPPPPAPPPLSDRPHSPPGRAKWLSAGLWTTFVLLLLIIGGLLLRACAIGDDRWPEFIRSLLPNTCAASQVGANWRVNAAEQAMKAAELDLLRARVRCQAECGSVGAIEPTLPSPPSVGDIGRVLDTAPVRRGRLEVTLGWLGKADLDLVVACPDGSMINYSSRTNCGGTLDLDLNGTDQTISMTPIEHVTWEAEPRLSGTYKIFVNLYALHGGATLPVSYRVILKRGDELVQERAGEITAVGATAMPFTFEVPAH